MQLHAGSLIRTNFAWEHSDVDLILELHPYSPVRNDKIMYRRTTGLMYPITTQTRPQRLYSPVLRRPPLSSSILILISLSTPPLSLGPRLLSSLGALT